ncbi:putative reverse transcriptase domain-containing protein [Tanacetum coccineum]
MLRVVPMSLTGAASRWLRNEPSRSIINWETMKTKFQNKYCPPARTAKKIEEINNFQQEPDESLFRAWERFKELLMKYPQHYLNDMQEVILFYNGLDVPTRQILDFKALVDLGASVSVIPFSTYTNLGLGILSHTRLTIELADRIIKQPRGIAENVLVKIGKIIFPIDFIILDIPEDDDIPLILGRPFLSTGHSKIDGYKRKITLRVGEEKLVFKSIKPATSLIRRVFMLKDLDSKTKLIREDNGSFDPLYGNYIELNDLDTPLEPEMIQDVNFEPTFVNEPDNVKTSSEYCYKMKCSCTIGYKNVNADFVHSLSVNLKTKSFYYSIIKDKENHEGKSPAGALIDIPIFVGNFSVLTGFIIIDDEDVTRDFALGMPFFMKYVSCQMIMKKFAHRDRCERMMEE